MKTHANIATAGTTINTTVEKVWDALVNPVLIKKYMFGADVTSGWNVGDSITWKGEWQGKPYEDKGKILKIKPNEILQYSHFDPSSQSQDFLENYHTVTVELHPENQHTRIVITQDNNATLQAKDESQKNWKMMLDSMKKLLESKS